MNLQPLSLYQVASHVWDAILCNNQSSTYFWEVALVIQLIKSTHYKIFVAARKMLDFKCAGNFQVHTGLIQIRTRVYMEKGLQFSSSTVPSTWSDPGSHYLLHWDIYMQWWLHAVQQTAAPQSHFLWENREAWRLSSFSMLPILILLKAFTDSVH